MQAPIPLALLGQLVRSHRDRSRLPAPVKKQPIAPSHRSSTLAPAQRNTSVVEGGHNARHGSRVASQVRREQPGQAPGCLHVHDWPRACVGRRGVARHIRCNVGRRTPQCTPCRSDRRFRRRRPLGRQPSRPAMAHQCRRGQQARGTSRRGLGRLATTRPSRSFTSTAPSTLTLDHTCRPGFGASRRSAQWGRRPAEDETSAHARDLSGPSGRSSPAPVAPPRHAASPASQVGSLHEYNNGTSPQTRVSSHSQTTTNTDYIDEAKIILTV